jgi:hypothetical protein
VSVGSRPGLAASLPASSVVTRGRHHPTPPELLNRGIYDEIAIALKGGEWRKTSMVMLAKAFAGAEAVGEEDEKELKSAQAM